MGWFTIDRTINFDESKVKQVLSFIESSKDDNEIENKMIAANIVRLQPGTEGHGFFRRRWCTFLRTFNLMNDDSSMTELAKYYLHGALSTKELLLIVLTRRTVKTNEELIRPFELYLRIAYALKESGAESYIDEDDIKHVLAYLEILNNETIEAAVKEIIDHRNTGNEYSREATKENIHFDIWKNVFVTAKLCEDNAGNQISFNLDLEILDYVVKYFDLYKPSSKKGNEFVGDFVDQISFSRKIDNDLSPSMLVENGVDGDEKYFSDYQGLLLNRFFIDDLKNEEITDYIYTIEELAQTLKDMYTNADQYKVSSIIAFGIKYGKTIIDCGYSVNEIIDLAGMNDSYKTELAKGVALYRLFEKGEYGFSIKYKKSELGIKGVKLMMDDPNRIKDGINKIVYGVPGCGKSFYISDKYSISSDNSERIVFHPDYTYSDFVGQILPKVEAGLVSYEFKPGPFTRILRKAYYDPANMYYLIIEEINRGNAPAIFGDIFQLLDRNEDGRSCYAITNTDIAKKVYGNDQEECLVFIPSNLTILATMNTADQNVFTLDTAFKRRWIMESIPNNFDLDGKDTKTVNHLKYHLFNDIDNPTWKVFATTVNSVIESNNDVISNSDKRLGVYFLTDKELNDKKAFAEKVLMYLWNDVFTFDKEKIFDQKYCRTLDDLLTGFEKDGFAVFNSSLDFTKHEDE